MIVLKFGGTSVANSVNIKKVQEIISNKSSDERLIVIVSAFSGVTDLLLESAKLASSKNEEYKAVLENIKQKHINTINELFSTYDKVSLLEEINVHFKELETLLAGCFLLGELSPRTSDAIVSFGELLSSKIISNFIQNTNKDTNFKDSRQLIITNNDFGNASVDWNKSNLLIDEYFKKNKGNITILPGFIASTKDGNTSTLGRGGSDYTAAIIANAVKANSLEIWTDVNGMYTANPKLVKQAKSITEISYQEAMELSHFGAKVLFPPTIQPVLNDNIPIWIKNTFEPNELGTFISNNPNSNGSAIKGISHIESITLITIEGSGIIGVTGFSKRIFEVLSNLKINIIFITQASSEYSICIGILDKDSEKAVEGINSGFKKEIFENKIQPCIVESNLCIVALVGDKMKNHQGISGLMFSTLGKNNINIRAIAQGASERNISVVINKKDVHKALNVLHEKFFEDNIKQLNLFVVGVGNVGEKLLEQIQKQQQYLYENFKINLRIIALSNSKKMVFDENGIDLENWKNKMENGISTNSEEFINKIRLLNLRNSIFIDNTANENVSKLYGILLENNISVVTCNKIACASKFEYYNSLKKLSRKYNTPFLFETNVGAGLPIIDTLKNLIISGDKIHKIQAVLSGSLNFIFNNFHSEIGFHEVVKTAAIEGYTEPDPKIDLSGIDVARKILILIREIGHQMEIEDIENISFLPDECFSTKSNEEFFQSLIKNSSHFENLLNQSLDKKCKLKYVAEYENGKAKVGLQFIPENHPFYNLEGKDNIVLFYTNRYKEQPLEIKGAGAGAEVTASGIFADIIRIGNF